MSPYPGDPSATWAYWTDTDSAERVVPDDGHTTVHGRHRTPHHRKHPV